MRNWIHELDIINYPSCIIATWKDQRSNINHTPSCTSCTTSHSCTISWTVGSRSSSRSTSSSSTWSEPQWSSCSRALQTCKSCPYISLSINLRLCRFPTEHSDRCRRPTFRHSFISCSACREEKFAAATVVIYSPSSCSIVSISSALISAASWWSSLYKDVADDHVNTLATLRDYCVVVQNVNSCGTVQPILQDLGGECKFPHIVSLTSVLGLDFVLTRFLSTGRLSRGVS